MSLNSLPTLLKRLEAATMRLEDIAMAQAPAPAPGGASTATSPALGAAQTESTPATAVSPAVQAYAELIEGPVAEYIRLSQQLGGLVAEQAQAVSATFQAQKAFLQLASEVKQIPPTSPNYVQVLNDTQSHLMATIDFKEKHRGSKEIAFLNTVGEGAPALGWVTVDKKPAPYVGDFKDSAQFWANRVVKDNKESNPTAVEWARTYTGLLESLRKYILQFHTTGVTWNPKGPDYSASHKSSAGGAPPPPPPPPPPPAPAAPGAPPPPPPAASSTSAPAAGDMSGVFAALNQGDGVTRGLKKVDKSEMTHKNPELRASSVVPASVASAGSPKLGSGSPVKPPKPSAMQKKPPKTQLDGKVWIIENHENNPQILIDQTELNHVVNVFNVKSSVIQIKGKVNAISLVNCSKTSLLLDSTVSSLSLSASPNFTVQILGKVPTILLDGLDGGQIYLSKHSLDVEIVSAKCSGVNVSLPVEGEEEGVFEERAVPEQLKTVVRGGVLVTSVVEHSG